MAECAPTSMDDTKQRTRILIEKTLAYLSAPEYVQLVLVTLDIPQRLKRMAKNFEIMSQRLIMFSETCQITYALPNNKAPFIKFIKTTAMLQQFFFF